MPNAIRDARSWAGDSYNPYKFRVFLAAPVNVAQNFGVTNLPFDTIDYDDTQSWDATNKWWVVPASGVYLWILKESFLMNAGNGTTIDFTAQLRAKRSGTTFWLPQDRNYAGAPPAASVWGCRVIDTYPLIQGDQVQAEFAEAATVAPAVQTTLEAAAGGIQKTYMAAILVSRY